MAKAPRDRYQTADDVLSDVREMRAGGSPASLGRPTSHAGTDAEVDGARQRTEIIRAPQFTEDLSLSIPAELPAPPPTAWWVALEIGCWGDFRRCRRNWPRIFKTVSNSSKGPWPSISGGTINFMRCCRRQKAFGQSSIGIETSMPRRRVPMEATTTKSPSLNCCWQTRTMRRKSCDSSWLRFVRSWGNSAASATSFRPGSRRHKPKCYYMARKSAKRKWTLLLVPLCILAIVIAWAARKRGTPVVTPAVNTEPFVSTPSRAVGQSFEGVPGHLRAIPCETMIGCMTFDPSMLSSTEFRMAVGLKQGEVHTWYVNGEGRPFGSWVYQTDRSGIGALAYSPNGELLASGNESGVISIWEKPIRGNKRSETPHRVLRGHSGAISFLRFNDDGSQLLSASAGQYSACVGRPARTRTRTIPGLRPPLQNLGKQRASRCSSLQS